ncbi:HNH endonuclease [Pseudoalteromonas sp. S2755]|uniref:HNH endonuclease n=1 Tax=Pseudoalteromonas sp. S2755 TaxID=2066523 RepID=UPI00110A297F|nr:HNH endonuclease [Pseudoalteromonas sp. S2755]TMN43187.1 HNH endonuclease [Pseudoalteromonas sp. S2755]
MEETVLGLGKEICEAFICGAWRCIPVESLRHYERKEKVVYRCHICRHRIVLMRASKDPAHFEHRPGNPNCLLAYDKLDPNKNRAPLTIVSVTDEQIEKSYEFEELLQFTHSVIGPLSLLADIYDVNRSSVKETLRKQLIDARCGQGQFRKSLISYWKKCAVSGADKTELLIASHIKPWTVSDNKERLDLFNGLLLTPNLDKAFDQGLISFNNNGLILISSKFEPSTAFGITKGQSLKIEKQHLPYLQFHRENVFKT